MKIDIEYMKSGVLIPRYPTENSTSFLLVPDSFQVYYGPTEEAPDRGGQKFKDLYGHNRMFFDIQPNGRLLVGCGYKLGVPLGYELQMRVISDLSLKSGLMIASGYDTLDSDCRSEVCILLLNTSVYNIRIYLGSPLAQATLVQVSTIDFKRVGRLSLQATKPIEDESVQTRNDSQD